MSINSIPSRLYSIGANVRLPSIKFRHGTNMNTQSASSAAPVKVAMSDAVKTAAVGTQGANEPIWDFQLPLKYRRKPLDEEEIAYINRGGPA